MPEYGLTKDGPNIKRLDVILDEMHDYLTEQWGVNTRQNPESLLNDLLTSVADHIAELWEFGEDVYYSQYPSSAEGISLDNAAQFGGSTREPATKSYYPIHCTAVDGTKLAAGTIIASTTNPATQLSIVNDMVVSRASCNGAQIKVAAYDGNPFTIAINKVPYTYNAESEDVNAILNGIAAALKSEDYTTSVDEENGLLNLEAVDKTASFELVLTENLTTETVTSIIVFGTVETGNILLPEGVITEIVKADANLVAVTNKCSYIAGNDEETDAVFRQSYADKIFGRSTRMIESIRSAILENVQGVLSVAGYQNDSNETDSFGRPPHSIEIVVDGGDQTEIAQQIMEKKAGGIQTFGSVTVSIPGLYGEDIPIHFNRPENVFVWFKVDITLAKNESLPSNYAELLRNVILNRVAYLDAGDDVVPQQFISELYAECPGISYIDITLHSETTRGEKPEVYDERSVSISPRQKAKTTEDMVGVSINE